LLRYVSFHPYFFPCPLPSPLTLSLSLLACPLGAMSPTFRACTYLALLSGLVSKASGQSQVQQFDPLNDYCRRFAHQTTVIDNRLYIDGGLVNYGSQISSETVNYTNTFLLYLDLDTQANNFLVENASLPKPSSVPSVQGGILWPDTVNKRFYLFGGEYHGTIAPPSQFSLWEFDVFWNRWSGGVVQSASGNISSVSFGAGTVVDDRGWGYYYGGWQNNATTLGWHGDASAQPGLIKYDMIGNTWSNITFIDSTPRAEGAMFYIPASDQGMLVYVGGVQQNSNFSYVGVSSVDRADEFRTLSNAVFRFPSTYDIHAKCVHFASLTFAGHSFVRHRIWLFLYPEHVRHRAGHAEKILWRCQLASRPVFVQHVSARLRVVRIR